MGRKLKKNLSKLSSLYNLIAGGCDSDVRYWTLTGHKLNRIWTITEQLLNSCLTVREAGSRMEYGAGSPAAMLEGDWVMTALYGQVFCSSRPKILVIVRIGPYKVVRESQLPFVSPLPYIRSDILGGHREMFQRSRTRASEQPRRLDARRCARGDRDEQGAGLRRRSSGGG